MKKLWIVLILSVLVAAGCSNNKENPADKAEATKDLISKENPLDERGAAVEAVKRQRDILKPGMIDNNYKMDDIKISYYVPEDKFGYSAMYRMPKQLSFLFYEGGTAYDKEAYQEEKKTFKNGKELKNGSFEGLYGLYNDGSEKLYEVWGESDGVLYSLRGGRKEEGYNEEIIEKMGKSLKTEEAGAYDPFYQEFTMNLKDVKFPLLNKDKAQLNSVSLEVSDEGPKMEAAYQLSEEKMFVFVVREKEKNWGEEFDKIGDKKIGGVEVTEFDSGVGRLFQWTDDTYHYSMQTSDNDEFATADIDQIIESSLEDDRTFEHKDLFKEKNSKPEFGENEQQLNELLKEAGLL